MNLDKQKAYRLINSKFPPIAIFDDSADEEDFEYLYALQSLTNPRLQNETGDISLIPLSDIPYGIKGCSYATAPFTHINKSGTRFSNADFGLLYLAENWETAIAETLHHTQAILTNIPDLHFDVIVMRGLVASFSGNVLDIRADTLDTMNSSPIYDEHDYSFSQLFGAKYRGVYDGLLYTSVRNPMSDCYALYTPKLIHEIIQSTHYEYIWDGNFISVRQISSAT
ncbi:hypothetical protein GCM10011607_11900 [Shewanella inventionis]|uniref:RES domain-containing protein n=1 Tax=Shewanella inventionis TaxID=1738770 RepID=A0ABQ1IXR7_9GAMM|nr:RES family NAD+ phosphorylase [Shewanella inventionis]GGB53016.1 hypothetical protein GCM10011607_11900 [Shewanella inventionis]